MAQAERDILIVLYRSTDGPNWAQKEGWNTRANLPEWHGVKVYEGRVVKLSLGCNKLRGSIPPELGKLAALELLELQGYPNKLGSLSLLETLFLHGKKLTGPIPKELGALSKLKKLHLYRNGFTGTIPEELGKLTALKELCLDNNRLTGPIPPELGNLAALQRLYLWDNKLSGHIPKELGALSKLQTLELWRNELTGAIPAQLGALNKLRQLDLSNNQLSGTIPEDLRKLTTLEVLSLRGNNLSGTIPDKLRKLTTLETLDLSANNLSGPIPKELGALSKLKKLHLTSNGFTGPIPKELGALSKLEKLYLNSNGLTDLIPPELGQLTKLKHLDLRSNDLDGPIPPELGKLASLECFFLGLNKLRRLGSDAAAVESLLPVLLKFRTCDLKRNPWELPPAAVVEAGVDSIRGYYKELGQCSTGPIKMQSLKVVFAGHSGAGKTSLIQTILSGRGRLVQDTELETVGVKVSDYSLRNLERQSTKLYDLAGQVDYYGLHQLFMTEGAVYVLTWDASKFLRRTEVLVAELMEWVIALHLRAPHSTVILVGTHSDKIGGSWCSNLFSWARRDKSPSLIMADVEETLRAKHEAWKRKRGISADEGLTLEEGVVLVSSSPEAGDGNIPALLGRFETQEGTTSFIPPSWSLALMVLDALKYGIAPSDALKHWNEKRPLLSQEVKRASVKKRELEEAWKEVQDSLPFDLQAGDRSFAMESALNIREFGGTLLRHGEVVFLDVEDLALRLAPILNHKTCEEDDDGCAMFNGKRLTQGWQQQASRSLFDRGMLYRRFAQFLWEEPGQSEVTLAVLVKLGILLPVREEGYRETVMRNAFDHDCGRVRVPPGEVCGRGFLVLMRLPKKIPTVVARRTEAFAGLTQQWGLVAKWEFHDGSTPHGLVERIIASCHTVGDVVGGTCWRRGACFVGNNAGKRAGGGSYALMVNFCEKSEGENRPTAGTLTIQAFGARDGRAVWGAMRFAIFIVWRLFNQFPGLSWQSWFECPADVGKMSHSLPGPGEQRRRSSGAPIVVSTAAYCQCSVAAKVSENLGKVPLSHWGMPPLDEVFQCPVGNGGGGVETIGQAADFTAALDDVLRTAASVNEMEPDILLARHAVAEWTKGVAKDGCVGVALALITFWEPILEMIDRFAGGESLVYTLPLTMLLAALPLALLFQLSASVSRWLMRRCHFWWSTRMHQE